MRNKNGFIKIFDSFREKAENAVPLYLSNACESAIKLFCSYINGEDFKNLRDHIKNNNSILPEAIKFIEDDCFFKKLIDN